MGGGSVPSSHLTATVPSAPCPVSPEPRPRALYPVSYALCPHPESLTPEQLALTWGGIKNAVILADPT